MTHWGSKIAGIIVLGMAVSCSGGSGSHGTDTGTDQWEAGRQDIIQDTTRDSSQEAEAGWDTGMDTGVDTFVDVDIQPEDVGTGNDTFETHQTTCTTDDDCKAVTHGPCQSVHCDTNRGVCVVASLPDYVPCDDGDVCTLHDYCLSGECQPGYARDCDDKNPCTKDTCDPEKGCMNKNVDDGTPCDDGNAFTQNDACKAGVCTGESTLTCHSDKDCSTWVDGDNKCKGRMVCDTGTGKCVVDPKTVIHCLQDPMQPCQVNTCDPKTGKCVMQNAPDDTPCEDGLTCTVHDKCAAGKCVPGADKCGTCTKDTDCTAFDDGNKCHGLPKCKSGQCVAGEPVGCEQAGDGVCGKSVCNPDTGKCEDIQVPDGDSCVTDICKDNQVCNQGTCGGGVDRVCDDGDPCTTDSCDPEKGCQSQPIPGCQNCSKDEECDDSNQCTQDKCVDGVCQWTPQDQASCDDGNPCTLDDKCNEKGECVAGAPKNCDDGDPCTQDSCDTSTGKCVNTPIPGCENCTNGIDDNKNGWTDCDDPYCKDAPKCQNIKQGDMCVNPFLINNGDPVTLAGLGANTTITVTGDTTHFTDNYQGTCNTSGHDPVQDCVYKMVLGENMKVSVSMDFAGSGQTDPWAVVYMYKGACGDSDLAGCAAGKQNAAVIDGSFTAGTYYIVVDGEYAQADVGPYTLSLQFAKPPTTETDCNNGVDDDLDGKVDCLDPDCANDPGCTPCDTRADLSCGQSVKEPLTRDDGPKTRMYKFTAQFDENVTLHLTPTNPNDKFAISVYEDTHQGCDDIKEVKQGDVGADVTFAAKKDSTYIVKVVASQAGTPAYTLNVACVAQQEVSCDNGVDDDQNSLTDCQDPVCFKDAACTGGHSGEDCTDPLLINDGKGIGMDDSGKTFTYYNTTKGANADLGGACAPDSAAAGDLVYKMVLDQQASIQFVVTPQGQFEPALYIFKDDCSADTPVTCVTYKNGKVDVQSELDPGTYFVVVDGASGDADKAEGQFKLDVTVVNVVAHEICNNNKDDDNDKLVDCQDPDCFKDDACTGGHTGVGCQDPFEVKDGQPLTAGDSLDFWNSTIGGQDSMAGSCGGTGAGDLVYKFVLDKTLDVTATLTFMGFRHPALYLYKDTCGSAGAEVACNAASAQKASLDQALAAGTYYLVVDGAKNNDAGMFDLNITAKSNAPPEASCWNTKDDNSDGAADCDDDSCKGEPVCTATTCQAAKVVHCGDRITVKNFDKDWTNAISQFTCNNSPYTFYDKYPEYTVEFDATCDTPVTVTLTDDTPNGANAAYDLYILDGSDTCDPTKCQEHSFMQANTAKVQFNATKGQKFYFVAAMLGLYQDITDATNDQITMTVNCQCQAPPKAGDVVITEVMNNPAGTDTGKEYFEVYNPRDKAIDLEGCKIQGKTGEPEIDIAGMDDGLHDTIIPPKGYLVFGSGDVVRHIVPTNGGVYDYKDVKFSLANTSDVIKVVCSGVVLDELDYTGASSGHSLSLSPDHYDATANDDMNNWCFTFEDPDNLVTSDDPTNYPYNDNGDNYGTPGRDNPSCSPAPKQGEVVINEIMPDPNGGSDNAYVEVKNTTNHPISMDGCTIMTNTTTGTMQGAEDGSHDVVIPANGYLVLGNSGVKAAVASGAAFYDFDGLLKLDKASDFAGIMCDNKVIDSVSYDTGNGWVVKTGASMFLKQGGDAVQNDDMANWCTSFTPIPGAYSANGTNKGTPGADNGECPKAPQAGDLVVTEMMIDPATVDTDKQYVEVYNTDGSPMDLAKCMLETTGGSVHLTDTVLPGNHYLVVGVDAHVATAVPKDAVFVNVAGAFGLDPKRDTITLSCDGIPMDAVAYDVDNGWTIPAGKSLNLDPDHYDTTANDDPANWCASKTEITGDYSNDQDNSGNVLPNYGTPGALNTTCAAGSTPPAEGEVVITEMMPNPNSSDKGREYVEVYNTTGHPISLLNCKVLSKTSSGTEDFTIQPADDGLHDTQIGAKGYFVFGSSETVKAALPADTPFYKYGTAINLSNSSDWVELKCGDTVIDHAGYSGSQSGHSTSLDPDHYDATANDDPSHWCKTPDTYPIDASYNTDEKPNYGTPGAANPSCG